MSGIRAVLGLTVITVILGMGLIVLDVTQTTIPHAWEGNSSVVSEAIILLVFIAIAAGIIGAIRQ